MLVSVVTVSHYAAARPLAILLAVLALLALGGTRSAHAVVTITVTSASHDVANDGNCTLPEALQAANANTNVDACLGLGGGGNNVIDFDIGASIPEIDIGDTMLPDISQRVHIEGNTGGASKVFLHGPGGSPVSGHNGLTIAAGAAGTRIDDLIIGFFPDDGVLIAADEVTLTDDYIGVDASGEIPLANRGYGVQVKGNGDQIGSNTNNDCPYACSLVAGNLKAQILLDSEASGARVEGTDIGTDLTGAGSLQGELAIEGVIDKGTNDTIGGTDAKNISALGCSGDCNVIYGEPEAVLVDVGAVNSKVQGNYIGLNGAGEFVLTPNVMWGIIVRADGALIGGTSAAARNVVAGAVNANVLFDGQNNVIQGNYVGMRADGTAAITGTSWGVQAYQAVGGEIGGTADGAGNLISGSGFSNVDIDLSTGVQVQGNYIGVRPDGGQLAPTNSNVVIREGSSSNVIGGTTAGAGNVIAFAVHYGVSVDNSSPLVHDNTIRQNSIYSNGDAGIHLMSGANDAIAPPVITGTSPISGTSCAGCAIEIFSDAGDEGKTYEGVTVTGVTSWTFSGSVSGPHVTATETDASGNTSAFSLPVTVSTATPTPSPTASPPLSPTPTGSPTTTYTQGDLNCDDAIDEHDFDLLMEFAAGLNDGSTQSCLTLGTSLLGGFAWGDLNCDGLVNALDGLFLIAHFADVALTPAGQACVSIGDAFT